MLHPNIKAIHISMGKAFVLCTLSFLLMFTQVIQNVVLAQENTLEQKIKATFLYKFGNYIDWPEGTFEHDSKSLTIGIIGADEIAKELQVITRDKDVRGRSVIVRTFKPTDSLQEAQILFVGQSERIHMNAILASIRGLPVVTVTEIEDKLSEIGIINFVIDENKVRFDIELGNADYNNIKISARLLGVARRVITRSAS